MNVFIFAPMMNRKAIITGATKGIGRAIAEALATEGYDVAVCSRSEEDLKAMKEDFAVRFHDVEIIYQVVDVCVKAEVLTFAQFVENQWNRVDVLVNKRVFSSPEPFILRG